MHVFLNTSTKSREFRRDSESVSSQENGIKLEVVQSCQGYHSLGYSMVFCLFWVNFLFGICSVHDWHEGMTMNDGKSEHADMHSMPSQ